MYDLKYSILDEFMSTFFVSVEHDKGKWLEKKFSYLKGLKEGE